MATKVTPWNKEKRREYNKQYYEENKDRLIIIHREYARELTKRKKQLAREKEDR